MRPFYCGIAQHKDGRASYSAILRDTFDSVQRKGGTVVGQPRGVAGSGTETERANADADPASAGADADADEERSCSEVE